MGPLFFALLTLLAVSVLLVISMGERRTKPDMDPKQLPTGIEACGYCGRENDGEANDCIECGTPFLSLQPDQIASELERMEANQGATEPPCGSFS